MLSLDQLRPDLAHPAGSKDLEEEGDQHGGPELPPRGPLLGSWRQDVSLNCKSSPEDGAARAWTTFYYNLLQSCLQQAGLPETVDRTLEPRQGCPGMEVTMCLLGSPSSFFSVLLEGGAQSPGNLLLCLSPSWLTKVPAAGRPAEASLLVSKAVAFHPGGLTFLEEFVPPRRVTYFLGELGPRAGRGREVAELSREVGCPLGSSAELARLLEDRLLTRQLLAQGGKVAVPATLALTYKPPQQLRGQASTQNLRRVELSGKEGQEGLVEEEVETFLQLGTLGDAHQVAVKPGGWRWHGSHAMSLHPRSDPGAVVRAVLALLEKLEEEESILVEAVCPPVQVLQPAASRSLPSQPELAIRVCAVVCRTQGDRPLTSQMVCRVGRQEQPLRHQAALPQSLDTALAACGLSEPATVEALRRRVQEAAEAALDAVLALEATLSPEHRGGRQAQTDVLGVDMALTPVGPGGSLSPVLLELNSSLCLEACGLLEGQWARRGQRCQWAAAGPLVETMLRRSARHLMEGKHLLVVGAGGYSKKFVWEAARDYGLKLHLVESDPNHFASQLVQTFIHFDVTEHRKDEENARHLAEVVRARGLQLDGCLSYWDDCLVLTALLCEELGLRGCPPAAMSLAKQKSQTQAHLLQCRGPRWPAPSLYAVPCCPLQAPDDVERAARSVPLPGVMKLEFGAGAVGVRLVEDASQCRAHFARISQDLRGEADHPGIGLGWGNAMLLMEFVAGTEHDVDVVIFSGRLLGAFVSDNGPTRLPGFTETAACMPTGLAPEREAQLIQAAYQCCLGCGLLDGVFNVEMKLTASGPRLIEINPRMGGFYLRDWIQELYGVDLLLAAAMVACGIPPALPARPRARAHLVGVMCVVSQHLQALSSTASREALQALHERGLIRLNLLEEELVPGEYEEPYCSVACAGGSPGEARQRLLGLCQGLGIDAPNYPVAHFLSHFK
ncbi:carnosine synthase 1 isoform X1 [Monodelphis domestica]|uniref:carnosine synthase 1 isoform X1 n=2 Tax=Monodelphis domestica TaxID=13616 RepID=UPI0024E1E3CB|nr:carnosine synthase 1 isoform X1 [Monodelphis domestica]